MRFRIHSIPRESRHKKWVTFRNHYACWAVGSWSLSLLRPPPPSPFRRSVRARVCVCLCVGPLKWAMHVDTNAILGYFNNSRKQTFLLQYIQIENAHNDLCI